MWMRWTNHRTELRANDNKHSCKSARDLRRGKMMNSSTDVAFSGGPRPHSFPAQAAPPEATFPVQVSRHKLVSTCDSRTTWELGSTPILP